MKACFRYFLWIVLAALLVFTGIFGNPSSARAAGVYIPTETYNGAPVPDWGNISFSSLPALQDGGSIDIPTDAVNQLGYNPSRSWQTGSSLGDVMMLGDVQDDFGFQGFSGRPSTYAPTIGTLKQRDYVSVVKSKLQPTEVGEQVDRFLVQALPKLVDVGFTAEMEASLDQIASGELSWEQWLTRWNRDYFAPALEQARKVIPNYASEIPARKTPDVSDTQCPQCQMLMIQLPSKKVKKGFFLKCQSCESVMFWSDRTSTWESPRAKSEQSEDASAKLTEYACPVCKKPLEEYGYQKDGQPKVMLRCSDAKARQQKKHEGAVYFQTANRFWSPKFGELGSEQSGKAPTSTVKQKSLGKSRSCKRSTTENTRNF